MTVMPRAVILERRLDQGLPFESRAVRAELEALGEEAVPTLEQLLKQEGRKQQIAAQALKQMGAVGAATLARGLGDTSGTVRLVAADTIGRMGETAVPYAADMARQLQSPDEDVRRRAAEVLGRMGPAGHAHAEAVSQCLGDRNAWVRWNAAKALRQMGAAGADALVARLSDSRDIVSRGATQALEQMGTVGVAALASVLQDGLHTRAAVRAAEALSRMDSTGSSVRVPNVGAELSFLEDPDEATHRKATAALATRGMAAVPAFSVLARRMDNGSTWVRGRALEGFTHGREAGAVALAGRLSDRSPTVRRRAVEALTAFGQSAKAHTEALKLRLGDPNPFVRWRAADAVNRARQQELGARYAEPCVDTDQNDLFVWPHREHERLFAVKT